MNAKGKTKIKRDLPPLCVAVRRIRQHAGWSQEKMAKEVGIALMTISRFELGKQVPRDEFILMKLRDAAADAGLVEEERLFNDTINKRYPPQEVPWFEGTPGRIRPGLTVTYTPHEWRLMHAARIAVRFYPALARAMEQAAGDALAVVDEALAGADTARVDEAFYRDLERRLNALAEQRTLASFKKESTKGVKA